MKAKWEPKIDLPEKPDTLVCTYADPYWGPNIDCPKICPKTARLVATVDWDREPGDDRLNRYCLSTNRSRSHWILWCGHMDYLTMVYSPYAFGPKKNVPAKTAAMYLLLEGWKAEKANGDSPERFPEICQGGILSLEELDELADIVWPRASRRKRIRRMAK